MTLPALITLAVLLPVGVFLALFIFAKGTSWLALRPRTWSVVMVLLGTVYASVGAWSSRREFDAEAALSIVGGALFILGGIYHWYRGRPVNLE